MYFFFFLKINKLRFFLWCCIKKNNNEDFHVNSILYIYLIQQMNGLNENSNFWQSSKLFKSMEEIIINYSGIFLKYFTDQD